MAKAKNNGNGTLDEAIAMLVRAQASLVETNATLAQAQASYTAHLAETEARIAENERARVKIEADMAETNRLNSERFARIEAILIEHSRVLRALPYVQRDKIGSRLRK